MTRRFIAALAVPAVIVLGTGAAAASDRIPADALSPAYVVHKLAADGIEIRSIEFERGAYVVDVATGERQTYRAAVDPNTASLTPHAFMTRGLSADDAPAGSMSSSLIVQLVDAAGYPDLVEMEMERGSWKVKARDASGRQAKLRVDPVSGEIAERGEKLAAQ